MDPRSLDDRRAFPANGSPSIPRMMSQPPQIEILSELVDVLVECADPRARERILVQTLRERGWAQAVAIYAAVPQQASCSPWIQSLSQGPIDLIPDGEVVRSVYCGDLPEELPLKTRVLFGANSCGRFSLVLGGFNGEEHELDLLEATFQVLSSVAEGDTGDPGQEPKLLDLLHGACPTTDLGPMELPETMELGQLLHRMGGTESLLNGELLPLADQDREHFGELLDQTCSSAAELFGSALSQAASELSHFGDANVAARVDELCVQGNWVLSQRNIELQLHSNPAARVFTLPTSEKAIDALLEEVLGRMFERLRRLRAGGGRVDIELERVDTRRLRLRVWTQMRRGREWAASASPEIPAHLLRDALASVTPAAEAQPGAFLELTFERPASGAL